MEHYEEAKNRNKELKQDSGSQDEETISLEALTVNDMATNPAVLVVMNQMPQISGLASL